MALEETQFAVQQTEFPPEPCSASGDGTPVPATSRQAYEAGHGLSSFIHVVRTTRGADKVPFDVKVAPERQQRTNRHRCHPPAGPCIAALRPRH